MNITKPTAADKLREALALHPASTASELVEISGLGRSTVTKHLAALKRTGDAIAAEGDRGGARSRWSLTGRRGQPRLRPGDLDGLVLKHVRGLDTPVGPSAVGKALDRSAGAVANCMVRLAEVGQLKQTSKKPRRYRAA
jgi:predicted ArsR family transcriptional regulator